MKFKNYKLGKVLPDSIPEQEENKPGVDGEPLFEVLFTLSKNELMAITFRILYGKASVIITSVIGVLLLGIVICGIATDMIFMIFLLYAGIVFIIGTPLLVYFRTAKAYKTDAFLKNSYAFKIFNDFFIVTFYGGTGRVSWAELKKIDETKSACLLFLTSSAYYPIPKRVFEGREQDREILKTIIREFKSKRKSKS